MRSAGRASPRENSLSACDFSSASVVMWPTVSKGVVRAGGAAHFWPETSYTRPTRGETTTGEAMRPVQERAARYGAALRLLWFAAASVRSAPGRAHGDGVPGDGERPRAPGAPGRRRAAGARE